MLARFSGLFFAFLKMKNWDDTIVALASPAGIGAIALLRISGPQSLEILNQLAPDAKVESRKSHQAFLGKLSWQGEMLDEALVTIFRAPRSFTGENVVEIGLHGSPYIVHQTVKACLEAGSRMAGPGEFTQRAYLNRKLDLAQAEAIGDLIASESKSAHRAALQQVKGGLSKEIQELRQQLIDFTALIELELDFSEEDVEFADRSQLLNLIQKITSHIGKLLQSFSTGQAVKNGIPVVIVGPPNAGKSTLLNALLEEEKALVSPIAGTTRDVIEDKLLIEGVLFRLVDTAGLRETTDRVEQMGIARTREQLAKASFALLLQAPDSEEAEVAEIEAEIQQRGLPYLKVWTKADVQEKNHAEEGSLQIAAPVGTGLEELKREILKRSIDKTMLESESSLITNLRHYEALAKTRESLRQVQDNLDAGLSGDLLATEIREALFHLGSITGEITVEDILGSIFSRFCIGK
jgi:tRNA modification GTPase